MKMRNSLLGLTLLAAALMGSGCSSDDDAADTGTTTGGSDTGTTDGMELPPEGADWFPAPDVGPDSWDNLVGLDGPVRVVFDDKNIPHIYAETEHDLAMAQGWVTARNRLFQLHTLRMAPSGRLAELLGSGSLAGDVLLRTHRLRLTAEAMAEKTRVEQPELYALLEAFASGVNQWIDRINAGTAAPPIEVGVFGNQLEPWTPADTMTIVRLQTWQLGFGGQFDADTAFATAMELQETFDGTNIEGVELDVLNATPPESTPTINGWGASKPGARASRFDLAKALNSKTLKRVPKSMREAMVKGSRQMAELPHNLLRGMGNDSKDWGSNNWVVSGEHTASGKPLVCNDPHLSLRNPAIFFQVHLSNKLAGGDYELSGVNFAGAPGIVLGTNGKIAWGATVFFSDVTDVYVETLSDDGKTVLFNGEQVALTERIESFDYIKPSGEGCEAAITGWMNNLSPQVEATGDYACRVTMTIKEVPHHGPLIPWTIGTDNDGKPMAMSWKWTGFEPTDDMLAVDHINRATNFEEFKAALNHFGVGAQNWVYGDQEGNIGWYPSHLLPIRKHVAECQATPGCVVEHPPFLPMPGDGSAEWDGFVPRDEIPQAYNPPEGFLVTANADPTGTSFDNDPFNDGHHYLGWVWPAGFRMAQAHKRVAAAVEKGNVTKEDMMAAQADHHSNLGARLRQPLLDAMGDTADLAGPVKAAVEALVAWNLMAVSGVDGDGSAQDAGATSVMNVYTTFLVQRALGDEGIAPTDAVLVRLLLRMIESPETMVTWDADAEQSKLWDDRATDDKVERADEIMRAALEDAVAWLQERFESDKPEDWTWGMLHTLRLRHNLLPNYDIPPSDEWANGFPRHGDMFSVDASHPGMKGQDFAYSHGPAIRHVMSMVDPVERHGMVPGGQNEDPREPHYRDQMDHWVKNEAPMVPMTTDDVLDAMQRIEDYHPPG